MKTLIARQVLHLDFAVTLWCYAYPDLVGRKVSYKSEICSWKIGLFSMSK